MWLDAQGCNVDGAQAPMISSRIPRNSEGVQHGTFFSSNVQPQLLQTGLGSNERFFVAWYLALAMSPG